MTPRKQQLFKDVLLLGVLTCVACTIGIRELPKYDLGWHLAGGLWMLDHGWIPSADPFGAEGSFWLCYSWIPELLYATVYRLSGFRGLQLLQTLSVVLTVWAAFLFVRRLRSSTPALSGKKYGELLELAAIMTIVVFASPILYLRPQLYSLLFTAAALLLAETNQLKFRYLAPLMILWANTHILWVLLPILLLLYGCRILLVAAVFACALVNPYGWRLIEGAVTYVFKHKQAYSLILEFQHISPKLGLLFWLFLFCLLVGVLFTKQLFFGDSRRLFLFWIGTVFASILRIKFLPFFGVLSAALFIRAIAPQLIPSNEPTKSETQSIASSKRQWSFACASILLFVVLATSFISVPRALPEEEKELLEIARQLSLDSCIKNTLVFNHFDNGGWLALGFYLEKKATASSSNCKTTIDGRSLVMGETRLRQYVQIVTQEGDWCEQLSSWRASYAIVPTQDPIRSCRGWEESRTPLGPELRHFVVLKKR